MSAVRCLALLVIFLALPSDLRAVEDWSGVVVMRTSLRAPERGSAEDHAELTALKASLQERQRLIQQRLAGDLPAPIRLQLQIDAAVFATELERVVGALGGDQEIGRTVYQLRWRAGERLLVLSDEGGRLVVNHGLRQARQLSNGLSKDLVPAALPSALPASTVVGEPVLGLTTRRLLLPVDGKAVPVDYLPDLPNPLALALVEGLDDPLVAALARVPGMPARVVIPGTIERRMELALPPDARELPDAVFALGK